MTLTVAAFILVLGIAIGYRLPGPVARWKALYRRRTFKPVLLRPYLPEDAAPSGERRED